MNKLDLIVHESFIDYIPNHYKNLSDYFNIYSLSDLNIVKRVSVKLIFENTMVDGYVQIEPTYTQKIASGHSPQITTWSFKKNVEPYFIDHNLPRYVIWTLNDLLPICCTQLDRIAIFQISEAIGRALIWLSEFNLKEKASVAVFDLDSTLINDDNEKLKSAETILRYAREKFDLLILWSHGDSLHVDENVQKFNVKFDLKLSNEIKSHQSAKNLLYLYNFFKDCYFTTAILVDDTLSNYCPEYNKMFVPIKNNIECMKDYF